jgi:CDP-paratose 2-epimerase
MIAASADRPITIFGDGKQVRDVLYIDDLLDVYDAAVARIDVAAGQVYNVGGGPDRTMSVWSEFRPRLEALLGRDISVAWGDWRPGDQRIYVSDISRASRDLQWSPKASLDAGLGRLFTWVRSNEDLLAGPQPKPASPTAGDGRS